MAQTRNSGAILQVKKHVHQRVVVRNLDDRTIRKNASYGGRKNRPVVFAMKIVDEEESTADAVFAQARGFLRRRVPLASSGLLHQHERIFVNPIVHQVVLPFFVGDLNVGASSHSWKEMFFGKRVIDSPPRLPNSVRTG